MEIDARIDELLANLKPITLDEMKEIRLMNRTDTKFVTNKETLARLLASFCKMFVTLSEAEIRKIGDV